MGAETRGQLGVFALLFAVVVFPATPVGAQKPVHRSPHTDETANILGFKVGAVGQATEGDGGGVGATVSPYYERNLIPGWLEMETAVSAAWVQHETILGFEVLLKKPFHASEVIDPYVALGPHLALVLKPEGNRTQYGFKVSSGSYFWFHEGPWGLDVELAYVAVFDGRPIHELSLEAGFAARF